MKNGLNGQKAVLNWVENKIKEKNPNNI